MVETVGKKLSQARQKRGLTIDEASHATKLRPDKISALENDDYSRFANNIYGKGFLQIYARYLKVDVSDFARTLDNSNPISVNDYQYLSNAPAPRREKSSSSSSSSSRRDERRPPSLAPLIAFIFIGIVLVLGWWVKENYARILEASTPSTQRTITSPADPAPAPELPAASAPASGAPEPTPAFRDHVPGTTVKHTEPPPGAPAAPAVPAAAGVTTPAPATPAGPLAPGILRMSDQDFIAPIPVNTGDPGTRPPGAGGANEILIATVKKTWVTVRKDDPEAAPIFSDYVYPRANPLKLRGGRFFIEARDPTAVQITKNGLPMAYQPTGVPVQ